MVRKQLETEKVSAVRIQAWFRMVMEKRRYSDLVLAVQTIQRAYRKNLEVKKKRKALLEKREAAILIQRSFRNVLKMRKDKNRFLLSKQRIITIQALWRGHIQRLRYLKIKNQIILVQSTIRRFLAKQKLLKIRHDKLRKESAIKIQAVVRGHIQRKKFLDQLNAVKLIQSWWRMIECKQNFMILRNIVIVLQSQVRGFLARKRFLKLRRAVIFTQRRFRENQTAKRDRIQFLHTRQCIVLIQSVWRAHCGRKKFQADLKRIVAVQSLVRGFLVRRQAAKECLIRLREIAVVKIQSAVRGWLVRKNKVRLIQAVEFVQKRFRNNKMTRKTREEFQMIKTSVILIQSRWKGISQRRKYNRLLEHVITCQSVVRCYIVRRHFLKLKRSSYVLQNAIRTWLLEKEEHNQYLVMRNAAVKIQAAWRGFRIRKEFLNNLVKIITVQAAVRGFLQRKRFVRYLNAALSIQSSWRAAKTGRTCRKEFLITRSAAVKLQAWWRMVLEKNRYRKSMGSVIKCQAILRRRIEEARYQKKRMAAVVIQQWLRDILETRNSRQKFLEVKVATVKIQTWFRGSMARKRYLTMLAAVCLLQRQLECWLARNRLKRVMADRRYEKSIVLAQAQVRGCLARKQYISMLENVVRIQRWWRAWLLADRERQEFLDKRLAVVRIGCWWRMSSTRKKFCQKKEASITIQRHVRGWLIRKRFIMVLESLVKIQRWWRARLLANRERSKFLRTKHSSVRIGSWWRMTITRKKYCQKKEASKTIQRYVRGWLVRKRLIKELSNVINIQRWWRSLKLAETEGKKFKSKKMAVKKIEYWWSMISTQKTYCQQKKATKVIQTYVRKWLSRRRFCKELENVVKLQRRWRDKQVAYQERMMYLEKRRAVDKICSWWKMKKTLNKFNHQKKAIITIQRHVRGWLARKRFIEEFENVVRIQRWWRSEMVVIKERNLLIEKKNAIQKISCWWLMIRTQKRDCQHKKSAIILQKYVRGWQVRKEVIEKKKNVVIIQKWWRSIMLVNKKRLLLLQKKKIAVHKIEYWWIVITIKKSFCQQKKSAIILQKYLRGWLARKWMISMRKSCCVVQKGWRSVQLMRDERSKYQQLRRSVVVIQSWWRCRQSVVKYRNQMRAVNVIQRWVRGWLARTFVRRKRDALLSLQRGARQLIEARKIRQNFLTIKSSVVGVQTRGRGYLAREKFRKMLEDKEHLEHMREDLAKKEEAVRQKAAHVITNATRVLIQRKKFKKAVWAVTTIQSHWRGTKIRKGLSSWHKNLEEIRSRLSDINSAAKPEDCLGARTACAIDYIFNIKDVAELISVVKTLDMSTRLSLDCCLQMANREISSPVAALVSLLTRCNRSVPHMEVVSITLDILLNLSRVATTISAVSDVGSLIQDILQTMVVYRDSGQEIFSKCCALLQILTSVPQVKGELMKPVNCKRLLAHEELVKKKKKLKEDSMRRRSFNPSVLTAPRVTPKSNRKPLRTTTNQMNVTVTSTMEATPSNKPRRKSSSSEVATAAPWIHDISPRYHEDSVMAISSLIKHIGLVG